MDPILGMIAIFGFNFAPRGWAMCQGQLLPISQNTALFSLLGTYYGGNGASNFALPDMRSRIPVGMGQGPGLSDYFLGEMTGTETMTLTIQSLPAHNHSIKASSDAGDTAAPANAFPANTGGLDKEYKAAPATNPVAMNAAMLGMTGGSQPFNILQPYLAINFCIAMNGIYPSRN